jgi:rhodanese-related sulfurtransferase
MLKYIDEILHIHATDLLRIIDTEDILIIDIREPLELDESSIPSAVNIPMITLLNNVNSLFNKTKLYFIICRTGQRSYYVTKVLTAKHYKVINVVGGIALMPNYCHQ